MTHQEAMVIQDLIGGEIVENEESPGEYALEVPHTDGDQGLTLSLGACGWFITDDFGETVFSSDEMK
jgi:hypothetical protein